MTIKTRAKQEMSTTEKVKIFTQGIGTAYEVESLEAEIKIWFETKPNIRIVERHSHMTSGVNIQGATLSRLTITIFYRELL